MELARAQKVKVWTLRSVVAVAGMDVSANEPIMCNRILYELVQAV